MIHTPHILQHSSLLQVAGFYNNWFCASNNFFQKLCTILCRLIFLLKTIFQSVALLSHFHLQTDGCLRTPNEYMRRNKKLHITHNLYLTTHFIFRKKSNHFFSSGFTDNGL